MPPGRGGHLPMADKAFFDNPELALIRPMPTANTIGCRENFDLRAVNEFRHKVGLIIGSPPKSDGPRRSVTAIGGLSAIKVGGGRCTISMGYITAMDVKEAFLDTTGSDGLGFTVDPDGTGTFAAAGSDHVDANFWWQFAWRWKTSTRT